MAMRRITPRLALFIATIAFLSCRNATSPVSDIQGTWSRPFSFPGSSLVLNITQSGSTLGGTGTYSIEAGRSGTLQLSGTYVRPNVSFTITYDYGTPVTFTGSVSDPRHMAGTLTGDSGSSSLTLTR
jgi:hypothetical protein